MGSSGSAVKIQHVFGIGDVLVLQGQYWLPGTLKSALQTFELERSHWSDLQTAESYKGAEFYSFLGFSKVLKQFVLDFKCIAPTLNWSSESQNFYFERWERAEIVRWKRCNSVVVTDDICITESIRKLYSWHRPKWQENALGFTTGAAGGISEAHGALERLWNMVEQSYETMDRKFLNIVFAILVLIPNLEDSRFAVQTNNDALWGKLNMGDARGKLRKCWVHFFEFYFDVFHQVIVKCEASYALSYLNMTGEDEFTLKIDAPVMKIADAQPKGKNTKSDSTIWYSLSWNDCTDAVIPSLP